MDRQFVDDAHRTSSPAPLSPVSLLRPSGDFSRVVTPFDCNDQSNLAQPLKGDHIRSLRSLHTKNGGATFSPLHDSLLGWQLYAVSCMEPVIVPGSCLSLDQVGEFCEQHWDKLCRPNIVFGTWFDRETEVSCLGISVVLPGVQQALRLANQLNERYIYDLLRRKDLPVF